MNNEIWPRIRDLPEKEREPFRKALAGQTVPLVENVSIEEQDFYFPWDYDRWKQGKPPLD
jgi:hypothetical protein